MYLSRMYVRIVEKTEAKTKKGATYLRLRCEIAGNPQGLKSADKVDVIVFGDDAHLGFIKENAVLTALVTLEAKNDKIQANLRDIKEK